VAPLSEYDRGKWTMDRRVILGIAVAATALAMAPMLVGISSAQQGTTTYTFEECEEGWTTESASENPLATSWERTAGGHESEFSFALSGPGGLEDESLVSPAHTGTGAAVTVSYFLNYETEEDFDFLTLDWSTDGAAWETLKEYSGTSEGFPEFVEDSATFTPPAGAFQIRFRYVSDFPAPPSPGEMAVDDIKVNRPRPADATCASPSASASATSSASPTASPTGSPNPTVSPSPTASPTPRPDERDCTLQGTDEDDTLTGTSGNDVICSYGGDDTVLGKGGNDTLYGDGGEDNLRGGGGKDKLKGGGASDNLGGGKGDDSHSGGRGKDTCSDTQGSNTFKACEKD
jgi:Ca2+-binding RTX toxin-like protein